MGTTQHGGMVSRLRRKHVPHGEITHIGVLQRRGDIETTDHADNATRSRAFTTRDDAVVWLRGQVGEAHGGDTTLMSYYNGIEIVTSTEGPVWGVVIDVGIRS